MKKILFICSICLAACSNPQTPVGDCYDSLIDENCSSPDIAYKEGNHVFSGEFLDNNNIVYSVITYNNMGSIISWDTWRYNLVSGEKSLVKSNTQSGKKEVINSSEFYLSDNGKIGVMNIATGVFTPITSGPLDISPCRFDNTDELIFQKVTPNPYHMVLINKQGQRIDSLSGFDCVYCDSRNDSTIYCITTVSGTGEIYKINKSSVTTPEYVRGVGPAQSTEISFAFIPHTDKIVWEGNNQGLFITNIITGETVTLKNSCPGTAYTTGIAVSPDGAKILVTVQRARPVAQCIVETYRELHVMNIDGSDEKILNL